MYFKTIVKIMKGEHDPLSGNILTMVHSLYSAMTVCGRLLFLLLPVVSQCGATEYYVRPTEPTNTSCPGQPCLTLNQYTNDSSHYFNSDTVFRFLPGTHLMDKPLEIRDVHNISIKASDDNNGIYPELMTGFPCQHETDESCIQLQFPGDVYYALHNFDMCCSAIRLINVTHGVIGSIRLTVKTPRITGITLQWCPDIHIANVSAFYYVRSYKYELGILVYESIGVKMESLHAKNFSHGMMVYNTTKTVIRDTTVVNSGHSGLLFFRSNFNDIVNTTLSNNNEHGVVLLFTNNSNISMSHSIHNNKDGVALYSTTKSQVNSTVSNGNDNGFYLHRAIYTNICNSSVANNKRAGIRLYVSDFIAINNMYTTDNLENGISLKHCADVIIETTYAKHNQKNGIIFESCSNTAMMEISTTHNQNDGLQMFDSTNTSMVNILAAHNQVSGLQLTELHSTNMTNISLQNQSYGMQLKYLIYTNMTNVSATHSQFNGIFLLGCTNTNIMKLSAAHNKANGVYFNTCSITSMLHIHVFYNHYRGIDFFNCKNTNAINVSSTWNRDNGLYFRKCTHTFLFSLSSTHNKEHGILLFSSVDTYIIDAIIMNNKKVGINLIGARNTYIESTTSCISAYTSKNSFLVDSEFSNVTSVSLTTSSAADPTSLPALIVLYSSALTIHNCTFVGNNISSIKAFSSNVVLSGQVIFSNNRAFAGTAFIFARNSTLIITNNSQVSFLTNRAINYGGVFYVATEEFYDRSTTPQDMVLRYNNRGSLITSTTHCFARVEGSRNETRLIFVNNTAGKGGDVLYGGLVALGYDQDWNCLLSFKNISDMSQQNGLSVISSAPSRVCFCNNSQPDCLTAVDPTPRVIYPGQTITIPAVVVGQDFGTVTGAVFAQFLNTAESIYIDPQQRTRGIGQSQCSNLEYTISTQDEESQAVLVLTTDNRDVSHLMVEDDNQAIANTWEELNREPNYNTFASKVIRKFIHSTNRTLTNEYYNSINRVIENFYKFTPEYQRNFNKYYNIINKFIFPKEIYGYPIYINISFRPCPPGFTLSRNMPFRCDCNQLLRELPRVKCHIQDQTITRSGLVWVGTGGNETVTTSQRCPLDYCNRNELNTTLEDPDSQCNYNHSGTLCGGCQPGLSLALGSAQCLHCTNTYLSLLLPFGMAGVVLVFFIKVMDLTTSKGELNGLILYANIVHANNYLLLTEKHNSLLAVFIAWLNLDFGIETCFFNGLTAYVKTWLQFVFPLYVWGIVGLIIFVAKYSNRAARLMGNNSVPVLATLFLLSYAKLFRTIITVLSFTTLSSAHGSEVVWSADGNLDYLGPAHAPLFAVAVATLLFMWLPYTLIIFLGQWLYRCNCRFISKMLIKYKPFLDAYYGPFKGNHRYWFGALLLVRAIVLLISALVPADHASVVVYAITVCSFVLTAFALIVYQIFTVAMFEVALFINLGLLSAAHTFTTLTNRNFLLASNILVATAFVQFLGLTILKILLILKRFKMVRLFFPKKFKTLAQEETENDWELYERER